MHNDYDIDISYQNNNFNLTTLYINMNPPGPLYNSVYGSYKKSTGEVLAWIRSLSGADPKIALSAHLVLANEAIQQGVFMPQHIWEHLQTALNGRMWAAQQHVQEGTHCQSHDYVIEMLQQISAMWCPQMPYYNIYDNQFDLYDSPAFDFEEHAIDDYFSYTPPSIQQYPDQYVYDNWQEHGNSRRSSISSSDTSRTEKDSPTLSQAVESTYDLEFPALPTSN